MVKKNQQRNVVVGILVVLAFFFIASQTNLFAISDLRNDGAIGEETDGFFQYVGVVPKEPIGSACVLKPPYRIGGAFEGGRQSPTHEFSDTVSLNTPNHIFSIRETSPPARIVNQNGNECGTIGYAVEVRKDNRLIDTINFDSPAECSDILSTLEERDYGELKARFGVFTQRHQGGSQCGVQTFAVHGYEIIYPNDSLNIDLVNLENVRIEGNELFLDIDIENNLGLLTGVVGIILNPTIGGDTIVAQEEFSLNRCNSIETLSVSVDNPENFVLRL